MLSFESLCLKEDDCPSPTEQQGTEDEFDTDLESDGESIIYIFGLIVGVNIVYAILLLM